MKKQRTSPFRKAKKGQAHSAVLLLLSLSLLCLSVIREINRHKREQKILPLAKKMAKTYKVDRFLVLAIISVESNFRWQVRGSKGEFGLMQIMPYNAKKMAKELKISPLREKDFFLPKINLHLGCYYLSKLKKHLTLTSSEKIPYLAAEYNAGWKNVRRWRAKSRLQNISFIDAITFSSTARYVQKVQKEYLRYSNLE